MLTVAHARRSASFLDVIWAVALPGRRSRRGGDRPRAFNNGNGNTATGAAALFNNTTGTDNVAIGNSAGVCHYGK